MLEGLALTADPNYKLLAKAYPYMAKRLLTDPAPELRCVSACCGGPLLSLAWARPAHWGCLPPAEVTGTRTAASYNNS